MDLTQFDNQFEKEEIVKYDVIPDGEYQAIVHKIELTETKEKKKPMVKWTLKILGGDEDGRYLWKYHVIEADKIKWLKQDLYTAGLPIAKISELPANLEKLLDVTLKITKKTKKVNDKEYETIYFNSLVETDDSKINVPF